MTAVRSSPRDGQAWSGRPSLAGLQLVVAHHAVHQHCGMPLTRDHDDARACSTPRSAGGEQEQRLQRRAVAEREVQLEAAALRSALVVTSTDVSASITGLRHRQRDHRPDQQREMDAASHSPPPADRARRDACRQGDRAAARPAPRSARPGRSRALASHRIQYSTGSPSCCSATLSSRSPSSRRAAAACAYCSGCGMKRRCR